MSRSYSEAVVDLDRQPERVADRLRRLDRPQLRAADQPGQREPFQRLRQPERLLDALLGQVRVGALAWFAAQRQCVPDD
jgi:hypothetical protein